MSTRGLLPGEQAVLGLLALRPMHGYEMARHFSAAGLDSVSPIEQSLLYTYLRNVEDRGLVRWEERRVGNRPPRKLYSLTDAGRRTLDDWLHQPVMRIREVRLDFLLKIFFLHQLDPSAESTLIARQIEACEDYRSRLDDVAASLEGFPRLVAQSKLSAAVATLQWLRAYARELGQERSEALRAPASPAS